jgi:hypothetical protein
LYPNEYREYKVQVYAPKVSVEPLKGNFQPLEHFILISPSNIDIDSCYLRGRKISAFRPFQKIIEDFMRFFSLASLAR